MSTYSVYNIKVDNSLSFTPGPTAGQVLAIAADGSTYWTTVVGPTGPQGNTGATGSQGNTGATGSTGTFAYSSTPLSLADGATISWSLTQSVNAYVTINGNRALTITGATYGDYGTLRIIQNATGSNRINTWPTGSKFPSGTYSFSTPAKSYDLYSFYLDSSGNYNWVFNKTFS